jgi:hypothetical protein
MTQVKSNSSLWFTEEARVRAATADDDASIRVLARLEDRRLPAGPFLVAEVDGEVVAALSIETGVALADPFRRTADLVAMLELRAARLGEARRQEARRTQGADVRRRALLSGFGRLRRAPS